MQPHSERGGLNCGTSESSWLTRQHKVTTRGYSQGQNRRRITSDVSIVRQFASLLLAVILWGAPVMACLTPGVEMTPAERECCKHMAQRCGSMGMPSSHSCCRKEVRQPNSMLGRAQPNIGPSPITKTVSITLILPKPDQSQFCSLKLQSPSESPPSSLPILRI